MSYTQADVDSLAAKMREPTYPGKVIFVTEAEAEVMCSRDFAPMRPLSLREVAKAAVLAGLDAAAVQKCFDRNLGSFGNETGLRDQFAKEALSALTLVEHGPDGEYRHICDASCKRIAQKAFELADAMMEARLA